MFESGETIIIAAGALFGYAASDWLKAAFRCLERASFRTRRKVNNKQSLATTNKQTFFFETNKQNQYNSIFTYDYEV